MEDNKLYYYDVTSYRFMVGIEHTEWFVEDFSEIEGFEGFVDGGVEIVKSSKKIKGLKELEKTVDF